MKKIYLMALTVACTLSVNSQSKLQIKNSNSRNSNVEASSNAAERSGGVNSVQQVYGTLVCNTQYTAGTTMNLVFNFTQITNNDEYIDMFSMTFPTGITPTGLANTSNPFPTAATGSPSTTATLNPIAGQTISWGAAIASGFGAIHTDLGVAVTFTVNVIVAPGTIGNKTVNFTATGDTYTSTTNPTSGNLVGTATIYPVGAAVVDMKTKFVQPTGITQLNNCALGTQTVIARVINIGSTAQSNITANYSVNGIVSSATLIPGPIAAGDSVTFSFPTTYNFNASSMYKIKSWVSQPSDINLANDTAAITISNSITVPLTSTNYVNGIESAYDYGSINNTWIGSGAPFGLSSGTKHSGAQALFYTISAGAPTNTYVALSVLPCTDVTTGETYKISFWVKSNTSGTLTINGQYGVSTGLTQDAAGMTTVLMAAKTITANAQAGTWTKDSVNFVATTTGTRYFALIGGGAITNTVSSQINVRFDDILISKVTGTSGIKNNSLSDLVSLYPNPTSGVLNINNLEANSTIEIFNVIGEKVLFSNLLKGNNIVDLSNLSNGSYFVKLNSNNQIITKKVILSK